jgi:hypothetical protein
MSLKEKKIYKKLRKRVPGMAPVVKIDILDFTCSDPIIIIN